jgi:hypothetical protein
VTIADRPSSRTAPGEQAQVDYGEIKVNRACATRALAMGIIEVVRATAFTLACDPSKGLSRSKGLNLKPDKNLGKPWRSYFRQPVMLR